AASSSLRLLPERDDDPGRRPVGDDQTAERDADPHGDERSSLPLRHLSPNRQGDPGSRDGHGQRRPEMTQSTTARDFSRKRFLQGTGGLVLGLSVTGAASASNNPSAVSPLHLGSVPGPP